MSVYSSRVIKLQSNKYGIHNVLAAVYHEHVVWVGNVALPWILAEAASEVYDVVWCWRRSKFYSTVGIGVTDCMQERGVCNNSILNTCCLKWTLSFMMLRLKQRARGGLERRAWRSLTASRCLQIRSRLAAQPASTRQPVTASTMSVPLRGVTSL